ncbi:DUF443 domain-containing protein [Oceanobacillus sp. J11TS1]|uniref:DUF443 domain-containing protein n=1 Tax=Oceanobacillus sp. J11TS1 TaxID=2807191 RepID=UPI001B184C4C|nr:DUF443 domain-containing protein [Oceanobacillus sp. J11TS1]GIO23664.1 hypothetical protein J11TS1_22450 [Oceanobacillus sp. J11TS1]
MNCEVRHLAKNMRYRILIIDGEQYILDMERSLWKIIFPFLFWLVPSQIFKIEDQSIVEQLKTTKKEKVGSSSVISLGGFAYAIGILLTPLMDYFEIPSSPVVNIVLLILALASVAFLYFSISHRRKKALNNVVELEALPRNKLWIQPSSTKLVIKFFTAYIFILGFILFGFLMYIQTGNIMVLIIASGFFFVLFIANRVTVDEGHTTVKFKDEKKAV